MAEEQTKQTPKTTKAAVKTVTFSLSKKVRGRLKALAKAEGLEEGQYVQRLVEGHIVDKAEDGDQMAERLSAKRAVIDTIVALAKKLDADGQFDEHFILTVMQAVAADEAIKALYFKATGGDNAYGKAQATVLNQHLGRMIRTAAGAKGKKNAEGAVARAQVKGELIRTYTLLERG